MPWRTPCVQCGRKAVDPAWRPFCSERCRMLDLANWLDGRYRVPAGEHPGGESGTEHPRRSGPSRPSDPS